MKAIKICLCLFLFGCNNTPNINQNNRQNIENFLNTFYAYMGNNFKSCKIGDIFLNEHIEFYIQDNKKNKVNIVINDSEEEFLLLINNFILGSGNIVSVKIYEMNFRTQVYDVPIRDLFVIKNDITYENLTTNETFFIKQTGEGLKIYRYFININ